MRFVYPLFFLLFFSLIVRGQSSRLELKGGAAKRFAKEITELTLIIPIGSEKDPEEKALMEAVKKYWKASKYKFVSGKDFESIYKAHFKEHQDFMYLVRESYDRHKTKRKDWSFTKFYISRNPTFVELWDDPFLQFKVPVKATDRKDAEPLNCSFIYGLMMKHFNREVLYMQDPEKYGKVSRKRLYKSTFKGHLEQYANMDLLVSRKELDNFMMNLPEKKKGKEQEAKFFKYLAKKTKIDPKRIRFASDNEIQKAVSAEDKNVLIYSGFTIFRAQDAAMLRRIDPYRSGRIASTIGFTITFIITLSLAVLLILYI